MTAGAITSYLYRWNNREVEKRRWIEDMTFIPWTGAGGSQDGVCRLTKAGEGHNVEIIRCYPKCYYEAVCVPKMR